MKSYPPVQEFMMTLAATRLSPEKFALLQYKLATGSPTARRIMGTIKPGEWECAVGDSREFNDIRDRLEEAIDAWVNSNPTSKGFVWKSAKIDYLNLSRAAHLLAQLTNDPSAANDTQAIIEAGAHGEIPIYWRNSAQIWTRLSDFKGDLKHKDSADRHMQIHATDVARLETAQQVDVLSFELTDQDKARLQHIQPPEPPGTGGEVFIGEPGYRHAVDHQPVTITRDQLRVSTADLHDYAATLTPAAVAAPPPAPAIKSAAVDQVQATPTTSSTPLNWSINKPPNFKRYSEAVYKYLKAAIDAKTPNRPTASDMVDAWQKMPIAPVIGVEDGIVRYWNSKGITVEIGDTPTKTLENIRKVILRMTTQSSS